MLLKKIDSLRLGLSLIEIIVAMVIMSLVMLGFINLFIRSKGFIIHSRSLMTGGELGRYFLDPLQMEVRQDTWNTAANNLRPRTYDGNNMTISGITYTPNYTVSNTTVCSSSIIRKVKLVLRWNETSP
jgi:prepilin-type N-terminal cleavage/methylation domain-containing protein